MYSGGNSDDNAGHSLGGSGPPAASPAEMRQRRLAALGGTPGTSSSTAVASSRGMETTAASTHQATTSSGGMERTAASSVDNDHDDENAELQAALAMSLENDDHTPTKETATTMKSSSTDEFNISAFHSIMWDSLVTTDNDKLRWVNQGIQTRGDGSLSLKTQNLDALALVGSNHGPWGLTQTHGGPCGVLAAVQAELLRLLLFGRRHNDTLEYPTELTNDDEKKPPANNESSCISQEVVRRGLAMAIAIILARAAVTPPASNQSQNNDSDAKVCVVLPSTRRALSWDDLEPWSSGTTTTTSASPKLRVYTVTVSQNSNTAKRQKTNLSISNETLEERIVRLGHAVTSFLLNPSCGNDEAPLESFCRPGGVILLVMSLVSCRGKDVIQSDMDDPLGTRLTSQFGHCSQELINLLLTGQAVSNVFDNTLTPSGSFTCRGIQSQPAVGYLSQLESLRYCEVGGYYKSPRFPVWVVGSTSHFTVLFGDASCLKESESDLLLEKCRRAFKAVEGGEENGFISAASLAKVLSLLDLKVKDNAVHTLAATLEVSGASIILWDDFWKAASRLLTGASIESVLQGDNKGASQDNSDEMPPLLITQHGEETHGVIKSASHKSLVDSDEELARKLAAEWGSAGVGDATVSSSDAVAARPASPMDMDTAPPSSAGMSDEEYARLLQAEWGDSSDAMPKTTLERSEVVVVNETAAATLPPPSSSTPPPSPSADQKLEFEQFGNSFKLYHYNGLRGGSLTPFCVTRLSADEAVGHSIALTQHSGASGGSAPQGSGGGDLEDVVRTKWPSCTINWLGNSPPYID